jgi:hypothetical protein
VFVRRAAERAAATLTTPLHTNLQKKQLLAEGADVHAVPQTTARGKGGALHEAVAARHEAAVELLLQHR